MIIKPSTIMRNDYKLISYYAHNNEEIILLTKHGEGDLVVMSIETFKKREEQLLLYHTVEEVEKNRQKNIGESINCEDAITGLKATFID